MTTYPPPVPGRCPVCRRRTWLPALGLGDESSAPRATCEACGHVGPYATFRGADPASCRCPGCRAAIPLQPAHLHVLQADGNPFAAPPAPADPYTTCPRCGFLSEHAVFVFPGTEPSHTGLQAAHPCLAALRIADALAAIDTWLAAPQREDPTPVRALRAWWASRV